MDSCGRGRPLACLINVAAAGCVCGLPQEKVSSHTTPFAVKHSAKHTPPTNVGERSHTVEQTT